MRLPVLLLILTVLTLLATPVYAGPPNQPTADGIEAVCPDGTRITNGVEVVVNMRPGFTYTATAIGVDTFDPIIAVGDPDGIVLCQDDDAAAARYAANLPTSGDVPASAASSQVPFSHDNESFTDISLIIGDASGAAGQFVLILEGMAVTTADGRGNGSGDPFAVHLTPNMIDTGVPLSVYMISVTDELDPLMQMVDADENVVELDDGSRVECDDAGDTSLCWGESSSLVTSSVSRSAGRQTPGGPRDAMLAVSLNDWELSDDPAGNYLNYLMTSYQQGTYGDYVVAFHIGIGGEGGAALVVPTPQGGKDELTGDAAGIEAVCPDGTVITNGVEVVVNMRPGFTYTATVIGLDSFDPIIAVSDRANGVQLCQDDTAAAAAYTADLPSTGTVDSSPTSAQLPFSHNYRDFTDISLIIGGREGATGEFILILEGMAVTQADGSGAGAGDPFAVRLTPNMVGSGVPVEVYMLSITSELDSMIQVVDEEGSVIVLNNDQRVECDDAGDENTCWGNSDSLAGAFVSRSAGRQTPGGPRDAMLQFPLDGVSLDADPEANFLEFRMTSYRQQTYGDYVVAFHIGIGAAGEAPNL